MALEATGNTWAIAAVLASRAGRVVVSNPAKTRAIAEAKIKTGFASSLDNGLGMPVLGLVRAFDDTFSPRINLSWTVRRDRGG